MPCWQKFLLACRVSRAKRLHGKIFISPGRDPASFHRELAKGEFLTRLRHVNISPGNLKFSIEGELPGKASNSINRVTRLHINRPLVHQIVWYFDCSQNTFQTSTLCQPMSLCIFKSSVLNRPILHASHF